MHHQVLSDRIQIMCMQQFLFFYVAKFDDFQC